MEALLAFGIIFIVIVLILVIVLYVVLGIVLNKLNKLMYGKGTAMAWIPLANIYLLGKLTVSKLLGWILLVVLFSISSYTTTIDGVAKSVTLLPENISSILSIVYNGVVLVLFIYAIIKISKLKNKKNIDTLSSDNATILNQNNEQVMTQPKHPQEKPKKLTNEVQEPIIKEEPTVLKQVQPQKDVSQPQPMVNQQVQAQNNNQTPSELNNLFNTNNKN